MQKNITFEDYSLNLTDDDCNNWAYICDECAKKYNINPALLDDSGGNPERDDSPLCSIKGCQNKANAYIDFPKDIPAPTNASTNIPEWKIPLEKLQCKTIPAKNNTKTKILNVGVFCSAYYNSYIKVPADMNLEEAIKYAQEHIKELPIVNGLEYVKGSDELDKDNCDFE